MKKEMYEENMKEKMKEDITPFYEERKSERNIASVLQKKKKKRLKPRRV
jgi:hypothetical protein